MLIIVIVVLCFIGVYFFNTYLTPLVKRTRSQYLKILVDLMEGTVGSVDGQTGSYLLTFIYKGQEFHYEDVLVKGINGYSNRAYLRVKSAGHLFLSLHEDSSISKKNSWSNSAVRTLNMSDLQAGDLYCDLKRMKVMTNDSDQASHLLGQNKIIRILSHFKNRDSRGLESLALRIRDGEVILEFQERAGYRPNLLDLHNDPHRLEDIVHHCFVLVKALEVQ